MNGRTCLWWNVWLENFDQDEREAQLLTALAELIERWQPEVLSLQEVIATNGDEGAIAELLGIHGYESRFAPVTRRGRDRLMGNLIASREPFDYATYDCGSYGHRTTPLQVMTLKSSAAPLAIGNTHWLMMRPAFELHRWRQMNRCMEVIERLRDGGAPLVVGGDLNTSAHHPYILRLKRRFHLLRDDRPTWWYMARSGLIKASLDHIFATDPLLSSLELLDRGPSDHAPLLVRIGDEQKSSRIAPASAAA